MVSISYTSRLFASVCRRNMRQIHYDVVIVGGGVMGSSSAYFLKSKEPSLKVAIVERDLTYEHSSSTRSVASIRQQFSNAENILLSQWSREFMNTIPESLTTDESNPCDIGLVKGSYSFLATEERESVLNTNYETQISCGVDIQKLPPIELAEVFPWLNMDSIVAGTITTNGSEGWFDGWSLLAAFQKKASSLGVDIIKGTCAGIDVTSNVDSVKVATDDGELQLECSNMVNAAGCWAGHLMNSINIHLPVYPRKRYIYVLDCPKGPGRNMPLLVDPTGVFCRPEGAGTLYLCGLCPEEADEPDTSDLEVDYDYFQNEIWPVLAHRIPAMEELKLKHSWAGYYDYNTFDQNSIIGNHPEVENLYFINGFSGHGIQQSPAAGNAISELIIERKFTTIDLRNLSYDRILDETPMLEINVV